MQLLWNVTGTLALLPKWSSIFITILLLSPNLMASQCFMKRYLTIKMLVCTHRKTILYLWWDSLHLKKSLYCYKTLVFRHLSFCLVNIIPDCIFRLYQLDSSTKLVCCISIFHRIQSLLILICVLLIVIVIIMHVCNPNENYNYAMTARYLGCYSVEGGNSLLHSPSLVASVLSVRYETWSPIGWHYHFVTAWSKYKLRLPQLQWIVFRRPLAVPFQSSNGKQMPAVRVVHRECERV